MEVPDRSNRVTAAQPIHALTFWPVVRVASGNFLEMYDFQVFGYYAAASVAPRKSVVENARA